MHLRLVICLKDFSVYPVLDFRDLPGVSHNGQHYQLPECVLVEVRDNNIPDSLDIALLHPATQADTGHVDLYYRPGRHTNGQSPLEVYQLRMQVWLTDLQNDRRYVWPTGIKSLLRTIMAIEEVLELNGFTPQLWEWLAAHDDRPTPEPDTVFIHGDESPAHHRQVRLLPRLDSCFSIHPTEQTGEAVEIPVTLIIDQPATKPASSAGPGFPGPAFTATTFPAADPAEKPVIGRHPGDPQTVTAELPKRRTAEYPLGS